MRIIAVTVVLLLAGGQALAARSSAVLFLDGARIEQELTVAKGYGELALPAGMRAGSLRVRPVAPGAIDRVEVVALPASAKGGRERQRLAERRDRLAARLKALDTREEIFTTAAKSQSGKAPRRTKTNPEPLANIRRGTDFALGQLEECYRERHQAEKELAEVEARLSAIAKGEGAGRNLARIWLSGKTGRVTVSYLRDDLGWKPRYDFRLGPDHQLAVTEHAILPRIEGEGELAVVAANLSASPTGASRLSGDARVSDHRFPAERVTVAAAPQTSVSFAFRNQASVRLPPGEASCYRDGEYLGTVAFAGLSPGETAEVVCGR
jgi:hypothetical protein